MNEVTVAPIDASVISVTEIAVCPTCGELANLDYRGIQENEYGEPGFSLWNCRACGSTVGGRHILSPDRERALLAASGMGSIP